MDSSIFYDVGQAFSDIDQINWDDFHHSIGWGVRFRTEDNYFFRFQLAYGGEAVNLIFKATKAL